MRTNSFNDKFAVVAALNGVENISRYLGLQLVERKLIKIEIVETGARGRPAHRFVLTGKGRSYLALAKTWKHKAKKAA